MNDENTLLFEVIVDIPKVKENSEIALTALNRLRTAKSELDQEFKKKEISGAEYGQRMQAINTQIDKVSKTLNENKKILDANAAAQTMASGSVLQLKTKLGLLQGQYEQLSQTERENAATGGQLQKSINSLTKEIKDASASVPKLAELIEGLNNRLTYQQKLAQASALSMDDLDETIGHLDQAYQSLSKSERENAQVGGVLLKYSADLSKVQRDNQRTVDASKTSFNDLIKSVRIGGVSIGEVSEKFRTGAGNAVTLGKGILQTKGALTALTAVPIVLLLTGLYTLLTKTQAGMDFVAKAAGAVSAVFNVLVKDGAELAKAFIQVFTAPEEAIESFKRILSGLPADISNAARAGAAVVELNNKIAESEQKVLLKRAENRAEVERYKKISEDVTKSQQEREDAARKAYALENSTLSQLVDLQRQKVTAAELEYKQSLKTREDAKKVIDEKIKLAEIVEESTGKQTELQNQLNQITLEGIQQRATAELQAVNTEIAGLKEVGGAREKYYTELERLQVEALQKQFELDTAGMVETNAVRKALEVKLQADIAQVRYQAAVDQSSVIDKVTNEEFATRLVKEQEGSLAYLKIQKEQIDEELSQQTVAATRTIKIKEELDAHLNYLDEKAAADHEAIDRKIRQAALTSAQDANRVALANAKEGSQAEFEARIQSIRLAGAQEVEAAQGNADQIKAINAETDRAIRDEKKRHLDALVDQYTQEFLQITGALSNVFQAQADAQNQRLQAQQDAALRSAGLSADAREKIQAKYDAKRAQAEKEQAEKRRGIAVSEAFVNVAGAVIKALPNPILAAIAAAAGLAQIAVIEAQKFARGGEIDGPSHAQGGVKYRVGRQVVELEGGEGVVNKRSMRLPGVRERVSELNQLGGGVAFPGTRRIKMKMPASLMHDTAQTPLLSRMALGGIVASLPPVSSPGVDYNQLSNVISRTVSDVVSNLPPQYVRVTDVQDGLARKVYPVTRARK